MIEKFDNQLIDTYSPEQKIDATGLNCPLPLLKLKQGLNGIQKNQSIYLITTDENSPKDISRYCSRGDSTLMHLEEKANMCHIVVTK